MENVIVIQMPRFKKVYKKLHEKEKKNVDAAIQEIIKNPKIGQEKKGDLSGLFVYKFKINNVEMLIAYQWIPKERVLIALGTHENFYRDLKNKN